MTALTDKRQGTSEKRRYMDLPLAPGEKAFQGGYAVGRPTTGLVYVLSSGGSPKGSDLFLGRFVENCDNSSTTTDTKTCTVDFLEEKTISWAENGESIVATDRFANCYGKDDQTVQKTSTNAPKVGVIIDVDSVLGVGFVVGGL